MILGNLNKSNLLVIIFLFFGSVSVGFTILGETHYAIMCVIIGAIVHFFNRGFQETEELEDDQLSFGLELDSLSKMVTYGLAPSALIVKVTNGNFLAVVVAALYLLATAVRIAHYNRPLELQGDIEQETTYGLPLVAIAIALPILSFLSWVIPGSIATYLWIIIYALCLVGYILKIDFPRIHPNYKFAILVIGIISLAILLIQGPLKFYF